MEFFQFYGSFPGSSNVERWLVGVASCEKVADVVKRTAFFGWW